MSVGKGAAQAELSRYLSMMWCWFRGLRFCVLQVGHAVHHSVTHSAPDPHISRFLLNFLAGCICELSLIDYEFVCMNCMGWQ